MLPQAVLEAQELEEREPEMFHREYHWSPYSAWQAMDMEGEAEDAGLQAEREEALRSSWVVLVFNN